MDFNMENFNITFTSRINVLNYRKIRSGILRPISLMSIVNCIDVLCVEHE